MALSTITLKWDLADLIVAGLSATLSITPTAQMSDSTDHVLIPPVARTYAFTGGAGQLAGIVANDNAAILPAGTGYLISVTAANGQVIVPQFQTQLLTANGAVQWLDALAVVPVVASSYQYLPLPSGTPSAGEVPVATGAGEASAWGPGGGGGGSGTVTTMSVVSANGFAGTVANPTTTPAVTLTTSVTGIPKGASGALVAATAGTDYLAPNGSGAALTGITAGQVGADASGAAAGVQALAALKASNLSDLASASTARANLGLGSAALLASSAVAQAANNLSDLASATTARTNLGLGTAATHPSADFVATSSLPLGISSGGTGQATQQAALDALAGAVTSAQFLRGNGSHVALSAIQVADVPTLNQSTSGNAATATTAAACSGNAATAANLAGGATLPDYLAPAVVALSQSGGTVAVNAALGNAFNLSVAGSWTISNPTGPTDGQVIRFRLTSGGSNTTSWGTAYDFGAGTAPALSTTAAKVDVVAFEYVASISKWCCLGSGLGY